MNVPRPKPRIFINDPPSF